MDDCRVKRLYTQVSVRPLLRHPRTLAVVPASVPFGEIKKDAADKRASLAEWLTSAENPMFAKAGVNRIWSYFMGRGIIEPVDDIRTSNPPSNPELLDALTKDFVESGFDIKHIMKTIVSLPSLSTEYQDEQMEQGRYD